MAWTAQGKGRELEPGPGKGRGTRLEEGGGEQRRAGGRLSIVVAAPKPYSHQLHDSLPQEVSRSRGTTRSAAFRARLRRHRRAGGARRRGMLQRRLIQP